MIDPLALVPLSLWFLTLTRPCHSLWPPINRFNESFRFTVPLPSTQYFHYLWPQLEPRLLSTWLLLLNCRIDLSPQLNLSHWSLTIIFYLNLPPWPHRSTFFDLTKIARTQTPTSIRLSSTSCFISTIYIDLLPWSFACMSDILVWIAHLPCFFLMCLCSWYRVWLLSWCLFPLVL